MISYPKRLIEVDLPIKRISAHARREKSIRHGHISTLHIWWARRPLAACRAVLCASLWPDPADEHCPQAFRDAAATALVAFAEQVRTNTNLAQLCASSWTRWSRTTAASLRGDNPACWPDMRYALLDFIADFANWDASTVPAFLETARTLTQSAHEALGGLPGTRPLVVDPFAGGGAIPLEALRIGADAFASDLNPVAVLLNKVVLEYIPKYGQRLADEVRKWGEWIKSEAEKELAEFYPKDSDGATPIAYLWARTITCEGPGCGAEVPLIRSLWLAKKGNRSVALKIIVNRDRKNKQDGQDKGGHWPAMIDFQIIENAKSKDVGEGTVRRGSATCPDCGYTTPVTSVRKQLKIRRGGAADARLFAVVTIRPEEQGRSYRPPTGIDLKAVRKATNELNRRMMEHEGALSLVPDEEINKAHHDVNRAPLYGMDQWGDIFTPRQALANITFQALIAGLFNEVYKNNNQESIEFTKAVKTVLALALDRLIDYNSSLVRWVSGGEFLGDTFSRQALSFVTDFAEVFPLSGATGDWQGALEWILKCIYALLESNLHGGYVQSSSASSLVLPDSFAHALVTDPPYYDSINYAVISDYFYVWLKRLLNSDYPLLFENEETNKLDECVVNPTRDRDSSRYKHLMYLSMVEGKRILQPTGVGVVVFAHKSTIGWEAQLAAMIKAGWVITASWPIDSEMAARVAAQGQARLVSSIHLVVRPLTISSGNNSIGDWRNILQELPNRIHSWMPRLANEGVVGADAIFACLGPALEIFSRYELVEKASGEQVTLGEYLEYVWAAVAREALNTVFEGVDTSDFEEDARLTAIWFWVLKVDNRTGTDNAPDSVNSDEEDSELDEDEKPSGKKKIVGYKMEYDTARKLAQGLGANLNVLSRPGGIISIQGNIAALNGVVSRESHLIGRQLSLFSEDDSFPSKRGKGEKESGSATLRSLDARQPSLFSEQPEILADPTQSFLPFLQPTSEVQSLIDRLLESGKTVLDRLHQAMLLFGRAQASLLGLFLRETHMGTDQRFWRLAQALSSLYPLDSNEKRWVDGLLARKKGLGF